MLPDYSLKIYDLDDDPVKLDVVCTAISDTIYSSCKTSYKPNVVHTVTVVNQVYCNSTNYKEIAKINLHTYNIYINNSLPPEFCNKYLQDWMKYENLARKAEESEMNVKANSSWKNIKKDGREMWGVIDWKGKSEVNENKILHDSQIQKYFRNIFQSQKTMHHPTVSNIMNKLHNYFLYIRILDDLPNMSEVELALNNIHRGIGIDGLPPIVLKILLKVMLDCLLLLIQNVSMSSNPEEWNKQILHAVAKKNHTYHNANLRGIAIAPLLCSL